MTSQPALEVEDTFAVTGRGVFVAVRVLDPGLSFTLSETPMLGDVPIERWIGAPRKFADDGTLRTDYFVFKLVSDADRARLRPGQRVVLR